MNCRTRFVIAGIVACQGAVAQTPEWPEAYQFVSAHSNNYSVWSGTRSITKVVVHIQDGYYNGTISWFQNPTSIVSAHYVMRSSDGQTTQMVLENNRAYHASSWNSFSIGIEHEGFANDPGPWYTDTQYRTSARLMRYLTQKYNITRNRTNIVGHNETGSPKSCPGPWDWTKYMQYVTNNASYVDASLPAAIPASTQADVTMRFTNLGTDDWSGSAADKCQLGTPSASPYFVSGDWVSSTRVGGPDAITAPNGTAEFTFKLNAPATPGSYSQQFQLYRDSIGAFGPLVTLNFTVGVAGEVIIDNSNSNYSTTGTWSTGTSATGKYGADYQFITQVPKTSAYANWQLNAPGTGTYDVYAWWSQGTNRSDKVLYEILGGRNGGVQTFVNQKVNGGAWQYIGTVRLLAGQGNVRMYGYGSGTGVCIADAIKIVGPQTIVSARPDLGRDPTTPDKPGGSSGQTSP